MRFKGSDRNPTLNEQNQKTWSAWAELRAEWVADFARSWAELMEKHMLEQNKRVPTVAQVALREIIQRQVRKPSLEQVQDVILILSQTWCNGPALYQWAKQANLLR